MPSMRGHIVAQDESGRSRSEQFRKHLKDFSKVFFETNHQRAFMLTICLMFAAFSLIPFISTYAVNNAGLPESKLSLIYFCGGMCTFFSSRYIGGLADRYGKFRVFSIIALASLVPIFALTNLPVASVAIILLTTTAFMVLVSGRFVPAMALITSSADPRRRGSFMSVNNAIQHLASGLASLSGGALMTTTASGALVGYNKVGYMAMLMTVLSLGLAKRIGAR